MCIIVGMGSLSPSTVPQEAHALTAWSELDPVTQKLLSFSLLFLPFLWANSAAQVCMDVEPFPPQQPPAVSSFSARAGDHSWWSVDCSDLCGSCTATTTALTSWVQLSHHVWKTLFRCGPGSCSLSCPASEAIPDWHGVGCDIDAPCRTECHRHFSELWPIVSFYTDCHQLHK